MAVIKISLQKVFSKSIFIKSFFDKKTFSSNTFFPYIFPPFGGHFRFFETSVLFRQIGIDSLRKTMITTMTLVPLSGDVFRFINTLFRDFVADNEYMMVLDKKVVILY